MVDPIRALEINNQLSETSNVVTRYINQIKAQPDDFAHKHLQELQESIQRSSDALVKYEFKKEHPQLAYDDTLEVLEEAINFLTQKERLEKIKANKSDSHEELATELVVAINAIQSLAGLLEDVRATTPIHGVDLRDSSYKRGRKIMKATDEQFKDGRT